MKNKIECQNCFKVEAEIEEVEIAGKKKLFCDSRADGLRIEKEEQLKSSKT